MAQITSLGALPDPISSLPTGALKSGALADTSSASNTPATKTTPATDETQTSPLQAQLIRFSSVLSGLQSAASNVRTQYVQALNKVKSGSYTVSPQEVSRSMVNDMLSPQ